MGFWDEKREADDHDNQNKNYRKRDVPQGKQSIGKVSKERINDEDDCGSDN